MSDAYPQIEYYPLSFEHEEMKQRSQEFYNMMDRRRTVRKFKSKKFDKSILDNAIKAASTAPSGAHKQPWSFCIVTNAELKHKIRQLAEEEEYENYHGRMSDEWLEDLRPFGTDHVKEFLDIAPYLVIIFKKVYDLTEDGKRRNNYYVNESVGIATGFFLAAIQNAGLASLTHTPSPMNFLEKALDRPPNERAYLLVPVGYPEDGVKVPDLKRKGLEKILDSYD